MQDLELQQYLLDLQGYLVIENALSPTEVATLNQLVDAQQLPPPGKTERFGSAPEGSGFLDWGKPFCDLLDHPRLMPILRFQLGDCFRLDRLYGMYMRDGMPRGQLHADYGATARNVNVQPGEYFPFRNNQIYNGFVVVDFQARKEVARITLPTLAAGRIPLISGSSESHGMAVTADQKTLVVCSRLNNALYAYSLPDLKVVGRADLSGKGAAWVTLTPDGKRAYVADPVGNQTLVVDIPSMKEVSKIKVGQVPKRNYTMVTPSRTSTN